MAKRRAPDGDDKPDGEFTYELAAAINVYGDDTKTLRFRKPTGADLVKVGNPVSFSPYIDPPKVEHDMVRMCQMIARLANIPSSSVERITPNDLIALCWILTPFFLPAL